MKRIIFVFVSLLIVLALASCSIFAKDYDVEKETVELDGVRLNLPRLYIEEELTAELRNNGVDYFYSGNSSALLIYKEGNKEYAPTLDLTNWTAKEYASVYLSNNKELVGDASVVMEGELATFSYDCEVEGDMYTYYAIIVRGESEIWNYMFFTRKDNFDAHKPYFIEWVISAQYL